MDMRQAFPSPWIKGIELGDKRYRLTVKSSQMEEIRDTDSNDTKHKPVLRFNETEKGLVLNVVNTDTLSLAWGFESDRWVGNTLIVYFNPDIMYGRERKGGLRVIAETPTTQQIADQSQAVGAPVDNKAIGGVIGAELGVTIPGAIPATGPEHDNDGLDHDYRHNVENENEDLEDTIPF